MDSDQSISPMSDLTLITDAGYQGLLSRISEVYTTGQLRAHQAVNTQLTATYWQIGFAQVPDHAIDAAIAGAAEGVHQLTARGVHRDRWRYSRRTVPVIDQRSVRRVLAAEPHVAGMRLQVGLANLIRGRDGEEMRR